VAKKKRARGASTASERGAVATAALDPRAATGISRSTADADAPPAAAGAPKPIQWTFFRRYRILFLVYAVGVVAGVSEYVYKKDRPAFEWLSPDGRTLLGELERLNPKSADILHLRAMQALADRDRETFDELMDSALASNPKYNENLLRYHAAYLLATGAPLEEVNAALNDWLTNFPFTIDPFAVRLPRGPETESQARALEAGLAAIPWITKATLERHVETAEPFWVVMIRFRRGNDVDLRDLDRALGAALGR
jgi:hypothetical protein